MTMHSPLGIETAVPVETWGGLKQSHLDWLLAHGVTVDAMIRPEPMRIVNGHRHPDGCLDEHPDGPAWLAFPQREDVVFWQPRTGELATWFGRAFALGEDVIDNPGTYAFDNRLDVFSDPLSWLIAKRDGVVILDWTRAYERLRDCPRIGVSESLLATYRRAMRPAWMPELSVLRNMEAAA